MSFATELSFKGDWSPVQFPVHSTTEWGCWTLQPNVDQSCKNHVVRLKTSIILWGEAINVACFIQNCVIINKRLKKTPFEVYYKTKPQLNYFKTFGCPCTLLHTSAHQDPKFAEKADGCYFLGYAANKTAYRVYNKKTKVIMESFNIDWK